jgi:hypothetical protein
MQSDTWRTWCLVGSMLAVAGCGDTTQDGALDASSAVGEGDALAAGGDAARSPQDASGDHRLAGAPDGV